MINSTKVTRIHLVKKVGKQVMKKANKTKQLIVMIVILLTVGTLLSAMGKRNNEEHPMSKIETTNPIAVIDTSSGRIGIELYQDKSPITISNFLKYIEDDFYTDTIFHRVIPGFMIQGGGFTKDMSQKQTLAPISNEAFNGLPNEKGTVAMARTNDVDSATSQFFINLADNTFLDFKNSSSSGFGYCVFGKVVYGMDIVEDIAKVYTTTSGGHQDVPQTPIIIKSINILEADN